MLYLHVVSNDRRSIMGYAALLLIGLGISKYLSELLSLGYQIGNAACKLRTWTDLDVGNS